MTNVLITGASSGLGAEIAKRFEAQSQYNLFTPIHNKYDVSKASYDLSTRDGCIDISINAKEHFDGEPIDILVQCAGVNFIDWHENIPIDKWDELLNVNARALWLLPKYLIDGGMLGGPGNQYNPAGVICNIVSNASHMPMTHSAAYNASKGAAAILTRQMARELRKTKSLTVFGVSPNKMHSTAMSEYIEDRVCYLRGWTPEEAHKYQAQSLPAMKETDPATCAEFIHFLLSKAERNQYLNGCIMEYGI